MREIAQAFAVHLPMLIACVLMLIASAMKIGKEKRGETDRDRSCWISVACRYSTVGGLTGSSEVVGGGRYRYRSASDLVA